MENRNSPLRISYLLSDRPGKMSYSTPSSPSSYEKEQVRLTPKRHLPIEALIDQTSTEIFRKRKYENSEFLQHKKAKISESQPTSPQQMATNLRTRLAYAKLKLENGWEADSLSRLESRQNYLTLSPQKYFYTISTKPFKRPSVSLNTSPVRNYVPLFTQQDRRMSHRRTSSMSQTRNPFFTETYLRSNDLPFSSNTLVPHLIHGNFTTNKHSDIQCFNTQQHHNKSNIHENTAFLNYIPHSSHILPRYKKNHYKYPQSNYTSITKEEEVSPLSFPVSTTAGQLPPDIPSLSLNQQKSSEILDIGDEPTSNDILSTKPINTLNIRDLLNPDL